MSITRLKVRPQFPQASSVIAPLRLDRNSGTWKFSLDFSHLPIQPSLPPRDGLSTVFYDSLLGQYFKIFPLPTIITTPYPLTVLNNVPIGTGVGFISTIGGVGTYAFSLTNDAGGKYAIVGGNHIVTNKPPLLALGVDAITIKADNGAGSIMLLDTTVTVLPHTYEPTYYIYGF